ncbi:GMC oxidoreductase [Tropicimonas sediminicola]|uniref:Choline dehydrogenase n=1 Tax=Tropicimonas sediminicola TaxID=1031541 RepID=A0A239CMK0_9RHOB|nr:GMC family oxidoreductase [Tropicimonas sediminicola]SNS20911.1 Choline dehydrogenase [Tropicimonas sediminicola]
MLKRIEDFAKDHVFETDVVIVGAGASGLTVAQELVGTGRDILVLESGLLDQDATHSTLNTVRASGVSWSDAEIERRNRFHGMSGTMWSHDDQPYGLRCRGLGGSTLTWAGKCGTFDEVDFRPRSWVRNSGWPIGRQDLLPHIERATSILNLGDDLNAAGTRQVNGYDFSRSPLAPFHWQFAMSSVNPIDRIRFGSELACVAASNLTVLLDATVTEILTNEDGRAVRGVRFSDSAGHHREVKAGCVVLASSAIENPRLLLASRSVKPAGLGNDHDAVGRYLVDHVSAVAGSFAPEAVPEVQRHFGYFGHRSRGRYTLYQRGFVLTPEVQEEHGLLQTAAHFMPSLAPAAPPSAEAEPAAGGRSLTGTAIGMAKQVVTSDAMPVGVKSLAVQSMIALAPNFAVRHSRRRDAAQFGTTLDVELIGEQTPDPTNRVKLSDEVDRFGLPLADVSWRVDSATRRSLGFLARSLSETLGSVGHPQPDLADWVVDNAPDDAALIDMGHPMGTTRISETSRDGAVDRNCQVHGTDGLFVAGASVFPTGGHCNPTLMIVSMAARLAEHLRGRLA